MTVRNIILAVAAASALGTSAQAGGTAIQTRKLDLGGLTGVAYYTAEPNGYRVVMSIARHEASPALRFETTLASGQEAVVSIPHELGLEAQAVRISRIGDDIVFRQAARETASAE